MNSKELREEIEKLFHHLDTNKDGSLSHSELGMAMRGLGANPTEAEVAECLKKLDKNKNGKIEFDEFYDYMKRRMDTSDQGDGKETILHAFRLFDSDNDGFITEKELKRAMISLGEPLTDEEIKEMLSDADVDDDGKIDYLEFVNLWSFYK